MFLATLVFLAFLMNMLGRGVTETFAVFLLPVEHGLQTTRSEIAATYSIYMIINGLAAPLAGQLIDRFGARLTYTTGLGLLAGANILAGLSTETWHYYVSAGVMNGIGASCLGMVVATSLLSRWFTRGLGFMVSLPHAAVGAGMLVLPLIAQLLVDQYSWRAAHQMIGTGVAVLIPLIMLLPLARMTRGAPEWRALRRENTQAGASSWTVARAIRSEAFWSLFGLFFFTSFAAYAVLPHSIAFLVEKGFDKVWATSAFGMTGALSVVGIIAVGWLSDRLGRLGVVTVSKLLTLSGIICLTLVAWYPNWILVYGFVAGFGLMQGARGPVIAVLVTILFRGGSVGAIFGALSLAMGLGAGAGSWISGALHDVTGTYLASFTMAAMASFAGLAIYWISPSLRTERPAQI